MSENKKVKLGVIGLGNMGGVHVRDMAGIENAELAAVCDIDRERADRFAEMFEVPAYYDYRDLLAAGGVDAIIVATPHYDHTPIAIDGMQRGFHVLTEKPIAVHTQDGYKMIAAYEAARQQFPGLVFSIMFQQRTYGYFIKIKQMIEAGELGKLVRATWTITDWFRTQAYYDNGGWRATWSGEGGGVLLNQCPHNLDLYQWFFGLPSRVTGFAAIGKYHNIEVEDEVTAFFEYDNGMVGHFITSTGESPGTNRLEIAGDLGRLVFENGALTFTRNQSSMLEFIQTCPGSFEKVASETVEVEYEHHGEGGHRILVRNFCESILTGAPLIAAGVDGIRGLTLGNAIMLSSFLNQPVEVPFDDALYAEKIAELARASRFQKVVRQQEETDMGKSWQGA